MSSNKPQSKVQDLIDPVWKAVRDEAEAIVKREPLMSVFIYSTIYITLCSFWIFTTTTLSRGKLFTMLCLGN